MKRFSLVGVGALALLLAPAACALRHARREPLPLVATRALAEARELLRTRPHGWRAQANEAAARAAGAAPEWVAPRRVLDDLARESLLGHEALAARRAELARTAGAAELYLVGRLEGRAGIPRLERAMRLDPQFAWAQHGLAWNRFLGGEPRVALHAGERALELARGSYELGAFAQAAARYRIELGRADEAIASLAELLEGAQLEEPERTELGLTLARAELGSEDAELVARGFWRAVALLESGHLAEAEYDPLGDDALARRAAAGQPDGISVLLSALDGATGPGPEHLRARLFLERGAPALAAAQWARTSSGQSAATFARARALEHGAAERALEGWRLGLPAHLRDEQGLPREPKLRALLAAARVSSAPLGARRFGAALLDAGWFAEAASYASFLAEAEPEAGLELATRAATGQALLSGLESVLLRVDESKPAFLPAAAGAAPSARKVDDLDALLSALQPFFERFHRAPLAVPLSDSPRLSFAGVAAIAHPGPTFSAADERAGLGRAGEPVPGLAAELLALGRFGIFGQAPGGGGPDGTVLRVVGGERKEGTHLGVHYAGWVAWCEGTDIASRPGRHGAGISGAALHEGYWIDLEGVRHEWERLCALEHAYLDEDPATLERALAGRGPTLEAQAPAHERARWMAPLGEGERVLLAALRERATPPGGAARLTFDERVELTALHEEGHLTERTRFLPLFAHWRAVLGFALRHGFAPRAVAQALEYRAQLVALCAAADPRLVLADCLLASDGEGGVLPHGDAYRQLLEEFLRVAAGELASLPALDDEHYVLYQLHLLGAEDVRRLARTVAEGEGLVAD
ncbi:MAG: hypothetical protein EXS08_01145 [Planctomycetes bacterium]|nr:hypothetical protein [Planctomycetota bacterium]